VTADSTSCQQSPFLQVLAHFDSFALFVLFAFFAPLADVVVLYVPLAPYCYYLFPGRRSTRGQSSACVRRAPCVAS